EIMGAEQEAVARSEGGRAADEAFRQGAATTGAGETASTDQETPAGTGGRGAEQSASESAGSEGGDAMATTEAPTVQGCADADRVARQLCEAATKEEDPFLRAALWEEYNEYRKILARQ